MLSVINDCLERRYTFALGPWDANTQESGFFVRPCIVVNPPDDSRIVQEEQFGPIVPILSWTEETELMRRVNGTDQGLGATLWCKDEAIADRLATQIEAGNVWINRGAIPLPTVLFEGIKQSGYGGEGGVRGLMNYCSARTLHYGKRIVEARE